MTEKFKGKCAVVTGGSLGIGKGIAQAFAAAGANVLIVSRHEQPAQKAVDEIGREGGVASFYQADVTCGAEMEGMAEAAQQRYGSLDILCSNAGAYPSRTIEEMSPAEWDCVQDVNLKGMFFAIKACLPHMKKQAWGRIVLTSSITGPYTGAAGWAHYGAAKAGMLGFMRTAALEFAPWNITINAVLPGSIRTEKDDDQSADYQEIAQSIPMGTWGEPRDIAHAALFFAAAEARYVTGQSLVVDGGQLLPEY